MKDETLQSLMTAKILYEKAQELCEADDRYIASAGLLVLQDSLEIVLYAILLELGVDRKQHIEDLSFRKLMAALEKEKLVIEKSGTLKALNDQRRTVKHFGQLAEPVAVHNFFLAATTAINSLLKDKFGLELRQIALDSLIKPGDVKNHISEAQNALDAKNYFDALVEIRKAVFIEFELDYAIDWWKYPAASHELTSGFYYNKRGWKAPSYCRSQKWITENVIDPFYNIQIDIDRLRADLMEFGINTQDYWNVHRLTPCVFQYDKSDEWIIKREAQFFTDDVNDSLVRYCLDRAVSMIVKKQIHSGLTKYLPQSFSTDVKIELKYDENLYINADYESKVIRRLGKGSSLNIDFVIDGPIGLKFAHALNINRETKEFTIGYIPLDSCEFI